MKPMIPFNFDYEKPATIREAIEHFKDFGKAYYISGGTELITLARLGVVHTNAVIDLKGISDYHAVGFHESFLILGGGATLTSIEENGVFPLLSATVSEIADRTARNKITLAGNVCGQFFYREAVLPLLLTDCLIGVVGEEGVTYPPIRDVFNGEIQVPEGAFVFQFLINKEFLNLPFVHVKKRKQWDIGYSLLTVAALKKGEDIRVAFSGLCPFPFRSLEIEQAINDRNLSIEERVEKSLAYLPEPILNDEEGSAGYRLFVLKNTLEDIIVELEGEQSV
jgi:CO/xanthine dehydrogenase FAD-binding subunit